MADMFTRERRSEIMSHIRNKNTLPEKLLFKAAKRLWHEGFKYRKHYKIPGRPDLAFIKHKVAVFLDGEFWHGKNFDRWKDRLPSEFWKKKISENMARDQKVDGILEGKEWTVIRLWGDEVERDPESGIEKISRILSNGKI